MAHYIDKDALVAEIKRLLILAEEDSLDNVLKYYRGRISAFKAILSFLDTLEVKEVDLDEEYKVFVEKDPVYNQLVNGIVGKAIAKHFFELGLKAQK